MSKVKGKDLIGFLQSDSDSGGVHLIAAESEVFRQHNKTLTRTFLANHDDPSKYLIHVMLFDNSVKYFNSSESVIFYDYFSKKFESLELFYEEFRSNHNPQLRNILVIDKLNLFNCYCSSSQPNLIRMFYKYLRKYTHKIFTLINVSAATARELNEAYENADAIALLMDKQPALETHLAYIIKNRADAKPSLNKVFFDIVNDEVKQIDDKSLKTATGTSTTDFDMASLTTFKLTLNESEKESKNNLHLPYFDAQRKDASLDVEANEDIDEEDEEV